MKKKIIAVLLATTILICIIPMAQAADVSQDTVAQIVAALGIMSGDENGNLNLNSNVTRAELAKMLVCASSYKNTVAAASNISPFDDVPYKHWAASCIKIAAQNKWITGYLDGTYRPENNLTLEEAATAVLKLLGYSGTDFTGSYPSGQLALYSSLGLSKNLTTTQGNYISRRDCMYLFYNMLNTKTKSGSEVYIKTLGYSVNSDNQVDYTALINATMTGPTVVTSGLWYNALPFSISGANFYRNGTKCLLSDIATYDVVYYSNSMRTVWAYNNKVSGTYEKASPNSDNPTSVTVAGTSYTISSTSAAYALSSLGTFSIGSGVTLLLGKDGTVVGVISPSEANSNVYGIITSVSTSDYQDANGNTYKAQTLTVVDTSGTSHQYVYNSGSNVGYFSSGNLVKVSFSSGTTDISFMPHASISGIVSASQNTICGYPVASDIGILDVYNDQYARIFPSRLDGLTLASGDVLYYMLNEKGQIDRLILNNVTNDMNAFALFTDVSDSGSSRMYTYYVSGTKSTLSAAIGKYTNVSAGGCMIVKDGGSVEQIKNLTAVNIDSLTQLLATAKSVTYSVSGSVQVYVKNDSGYYLSNVSAVSDTSAYMLTAYYDKSQTEGGKIRIIVATPK